ncbi:arylsulfatase [Methylomonas paludis]|uniref:Arylsulfatase n=1 Tax=Methylomonas paludis TaxID=1173101 RepID=A0A975R9M9_9GAMM|nr:arylsulfatase [Methylomonas paludis]QWF71237.1 arylsulfatase [Methylomonas paludis]
MSILQSKAAHQPPFSKTLMSAGLAVAALTLSTSPITAQATGTLAGSKPNILYIIADDLGYSDLSAFGGEIRTPNIDSLVKSGRILSNHHVSTVCAVTRSMLYSGTDHHLVGEGTMGAPNDERRGLPGYEGYLNNHALSIAELLRDGGYHTYIAGKWHLGSLVNSSINKTPDQWGFEKSFTLLGGAASNHFGHDTSAQKTYTENGQYVSLPATDVSGQPWYDTNVYTQKIISYIDADHGDGKPFAAFATFTSPHWPLQVPEPWLSQYSGWYDAGYDVVRNRRLLRQKQLGLVPNDYTVASQTLPDATSASPATANNGKAAASYINANTVETGNLLNVDYGPGLVDPVWNSLTPAQKKTQARYMEVYAGMVSNLDYNVGLLIQHLKNIGQYDNTYIVFHSDNGAEGWPLSAAQDTINASNFNNLGKDQTLRPSGSAATNIQYGLRWAEVSATPFRLSKGYTTEGGTSSPTIIHLPGQTTQYPTLRDFVHIRDVAPTLLELAGISQPSTPSANVGVNNLPLVVYNGRDAYPITGKSYLSELAGLNTGPLHTEAVGEEQYGRAYLRSGQWKALWVEPPLGPADGHWQLFNIVNDRAETNDVSASHPDIVNQLYQSWTDYLHNTGGVEPLRPLGYY